MTNPNALATLAKNLRKDIGCHHKLIGACVPQDKYLAEQSRSDDAVALAKYLIQNLADRHLAVTFASQVGMPGYINLR